MLHKLEIIIYGKGMEGAPSMGHAEAFDAVRREFLRVGVGAFSFSSFTTVYGGDRKPRTAYTAYTATAYAEGVGSGEMKGIEERLGALWPGNLVWCEWNWERV